MQTTTLTIDLTPALAIVVLTALVVFAIIGTLIAASLRKIATEAESAYHLRYDQLDHQRELAIANRKIAFYWESYADAAVPLMRATMQDRADTMSVKRELMRDMQQARAAEPRAVIWNAAEVAKRVAADIDAAKRQNEPEDRPA